MRLPKKYLSEDVIRDLEPLLKRESRRLWEGGSAEVPHVPFGEELASRLSEARRCRQLRGGLESIEVLIQKENAGLARFRPQSGPQAAESGETVSRLLILSCDGSERFYRHAESLLKRFGGRVAALRLDVPGSLLGKLFFGPDKEVKAMLVTKIDLVGRVLEGVLADSRSPAAAK
jgi:hypothetical protein